MFTGIIEALGRIESIADEGTGKVFWISSPISRELKPDQSLSHNGACLTVEQIAGAQHRVTAIEETQNMRPDPSWVTDSMRPRDSTMPVNILQK